MHAMRAAVHKEAKRLVMQTDDLALFLTVGI